MPSEPQDTSTSPDRLPTDGGSGPAVPNPADTGVFHASLDGYEGTVDTLLEKVKSRRVDITEVLLAMLTEQYLEFLRHREPAPLEEGAAFVKAAATLIDFKAKALLPAPPAIERSDRQEERADDTAERLAERERFLEASRILREALAKQESALPLGQREDELAGSTEPPGLEVTLHGLAQVFGEVIERLRNEPVVRLDPEAVSVASRIRHILRLLASGRGAVSIRQVLGGQGTTRALVATFLAVLELVKANAVDIVQEDTFSEIAICRHEGFADALSKAENPSSPESQFEYLH